MPDIERIPLTRLNTGEVTESIALTFEEGVDELIVLELTNTGGGQVRLVAKGEDGGLLPNGTAVQDGPGTKRLNIQPLPSGMVFFVECLRGPARAKVVDLRTATAVLPSGVPDPTVDIDDLDQFVGRGPGESDPTYSSTNIVTQNADLEAAIGELDAVAHVNFDSAQDTFIGRTDPETVPTYMSAAVVTQNADLETAIGELDAFVSVLPTSAQDPRQDTFMGRTDPETVPTYSSTKIVTQNADLETAIGELDAATTNPSSQDPDQDSFMGRAGGQSSPVYTSTKVIVQNSDLETAISALDADTGGASSEDADQDSFMGRGAAESSPTYSSTVYVTQNTDLEAAVGELDAAINTAIAVHARVNYVLVKAASDFPAAVGGVRTLASGVTYEINGTIDLGTDRLDASAAACIRSVCSDSNKLLTSNATSLISSTAGLSIEELTLENDSGPVFDVDGGGTTSFLARSIRVEGSSSIGNIDNCTVISLRSFIVQTTSNGMTLDGTSGYVLLAGVLAAGNLGTFTFLTLPASSTFISVTMHDMVIAHLATQTALNISPSATLTGKGVVTASDLSGAGTPLTGINKGAARWLFRSNRGVQDSRVIGDMSITSNAAVTTINTINVWVSINATFASGVLERFTRSGGTLTYTGVDTEEIILRANAVFVKQAGVGGNSNMQLRILKNGSQIGIFGSIRTEDAKPNNVVASAATSISTSDTLTLQVRNVTDTDDLVVQELEFTAWER